MKAYESLYQKALVADKPANINVTALEAVSITTELLTLEDNLLNIIDGYTVYDLVPELGINESEAKLLLNATKSSKNIQGFQSFIEAAKFKSDFLVSANLIIDIYNNIQNLKKCIDTAINDDHAYDLSQRTGLSVDQCEILISSSK